MKEAPRDLPGRFLSACLAYFTASGGSRDCRRPHYADRPITYAALPLGTTNAAREHYPQGLPDPRMELHAQTDPWTRAGSDGSRSRPTARAAPRSARCCRPSAPCFSLFCRGDPRFRWTLCRAANADRPVGQGSARARAWHHDDRLALFSGMRITPVRLSLRGGCGGGGWRLDRSDSLEASEWRRARPGVGSVVLGPGPQRGCAASADRLRCSLGDLAVR